MGKRNVHSYTNGTSALKMPRWTETPEEAAIIAFPGARAVRATKPALVKPAEQPKARRSFARRAAESSEMFCSLKLESMLGCPYHLFTRSGIAALSAGAAVISLISLILGS